MDDVKTPSSEERKSALSGLGTSRKRVEDARFTQGKGNYVDDINDDTSAGGTKIASSEELGKHYRVETNSQTNQELIDEGEKNTKVVSGQDLKDKYDNKRDGYKKNGVKTII